MNDQAICSCLPTYIGSPPFCRPECVVNSDCPQNRACRNEKCVDPCPGACAPEAICTVITHSAICSCPPGHTGDPFYRCTRIPRKLLCTMDCTYTPVVDLILILLVDCKISAPPPPVEKVTVNPCYPNPCGKNLCMNL